MPATTATRPATASARLPTTKTTYAAVLNRDDGHSEILNDGDVDAGGHCGGGTDMSVLLAIEADARSIKTAARPRRHLSCTNMDIRTGDLDAIRRMIENYIDDIV